MAAAPRVFLDTSAVFAGIWSESGGARLLLRLGEAGALKIVLSRQVLDEMDAVLRRKAPHLLPTLAMLLDRIQVEIAPPGSAEKYQACLALCGHPGDARILADAWGAGVADLVSLNQKHILNHPEFNRQIPLRIGTPGDYIQMIAVWLQFLPQEKNHVQLHPLHP
jgi:predicted nucleic acid-binding protein